MINALSTGLTNAADFRLTPRHVWVGTAVLGFTLLNVFAAQLLLAKDYITPAGSPIGGDFVAFWAAAKAAAVGDAAQLYDVDYFRQLIADIGPAGEAYKLSWQYPPTYFLLIAGVGALPFLASYFLWIGAGLAAFAGVCRGAGLRKLALFVAVASPLAFHTAITGQNGFFMASLFAGATLFVDKRPVVAGLCAALLTVKPQLGILLPIAYLAGGHYRAFTVAAISSLAFAGASLAVYGTEPWLAFFGAVSAVTSKVSTGVMPLYKMPTAYSAMLLAGAPTQIAMAMQTMLTIAAAFAAAVVWRRCDDPALRAAALAVGAFFTVPYLFYYDLTVIVLPLALVVAGRLGAGQHAGGFSFAHHVLPLLFLVSALIPGTPYGSGLNAAFCFVLVIACYVASAFVQQTRTHSASACA